METKRCRDCGENKPIVMFGRYAQSPDGIHLYCKECMSRRNYERRRARDLAAGREPRAFRPRVAVEAGQKYCPACEVVHPVANFGRNRAKRDGLTAYCRPCHNRIMREQRIGRHGSARDYHLKRRYGLTSAEVEEIVAGQGGSCAVCRRKKPGHVDHNSMTGVVRGILCFGCNGGLGQFDHDSWRLRQAASYLEGDLWPLDHVKAEIAEMGIPVLLPRNAPGGGQKSRREYRLRQRYRVSEPYVDAMKKLLKGLCAICCDRPIEAVDHDHATGEFRGPLCGGCNTGMGQMADDPVILRAAADYMNADYRRQRELSDSLWRARPHAGSCGVLL